MHVPSREAHYADGDQNLPIVSAGFMCAKGWRGRTRFNPSGLRTYVREYADEAAINLSALKGNNAHASILGNLALIEDIMRVAAGASGYEIGGDQIHSNILSRSDDVRLDVG